MGATSSTFHSRLEGDLRVDGIAVAAACLFHLVLVFALITPAMRHEAAVNTAMRFAVKGPNQYDEIRVVVIPYGDPGASAPRRLMGSVDAMSDARFRGKVAEERRVLTHRQRGQEGESVVPSTGFDALERLRLVHGNLPTAQTEDIAAREIIKPEYPEEARSRGVEGTVVLVALVNEDGKVEDVALEAGVDPALDQAAMRAAYMTPFFPYKIEGVAQAVFVRMPYHFELVGKLGD
jgi:TonB family protein